ncbi:MAG: hypothetical protein CL850_01970 [Crocinitomicaceae bacterium]|nr:hypothetical protein [Crocinitomicaceae bacterium]|tara:strand:- start:142 stop:648 length:507 start_codon:yes stop_codon:yes gene_type:complete
MGNLKRILGCVVAIWAAAINFSLAQTYVYTDVQMTWDQMACHIDNGVVIMGPDWRGEIEYTVQNNRIFKGYSSSSFDIAYAYREGKLYIGESYFSDAISYTFNEGRIYIGDSNFELDLVYTIRPNPNYRGALCVYKEDSISPFDIVAFLQGEPTEVEIFALLITLRLI